MQWEHNSESLNSVYFSNLKAQSHKLERIWLLTQIFKKDDYTVLVGFFLVTSVSQILCVWQQSWTFGIALLPTGVAMFVPTSWKLKASFSRCAFCQPETSCRALVTSVRDSVLQGVSTFWADKVKNIQQKMTRGSLSMNVPLLIAFVFFMCHWQNLPCLCVFLCLVYLLVASINIVLLNLYLSTFWLASLNLLCELSNQLSVPILVFLEDSL